MTYINRPVRRETATSIRDGGRVLPVVIEIHPGYMTLRQKGCRRRYSLTYDAAYRYAVRLQVEFERRERVAAKGKRRTT